MGIAPLVAAVQRRPLHWAFGTSVRSSSGVPIDGGTGGPIGLTVELFLNGSWTDISTYVYYRDKVKITRGRPDETSQVQPQTATLTLNNRDGRFSPRNPLGPYYGQIGRNTPIRISRMNNGIRRFRFAGEVPAWPTTWDISGSDVYVQIQAAGMLRRLNQGSAPLRSPLFRYWSLGNDFSVFGQASSTYSAPVAYWPCEDGTSASSIASGLLNGQPMTLSGQAPPTFSSDSTVPGSDSLPQLSASIWTGSVPTHTVGDSNILNLVISVPTTGAFDTGVIASVYTNGSVARADLQWGAANGGSLQLTGYNASGSQVFTSGYFSGPFAGKATLITLSWNSTGYQVSYLFFSPLTPFAGLNGVSGIVSGFVSATIGIATKIVINPLGQLSDTAVGHVAYQAASPASSGGGAGWPFYAWNGETPGERYTRLCSEQNLNSVLLSLDATNPAIINTFIGEYVNLGYQAIDTFPNLLQQVPDTSFSPLFEARDQVALTLRSHLTLYNQQPVLTLDYSQSQLSGPLDPVDDDAQTRNDITVTRNQGSSVQMRQLTGTMNIQQAPAGVGDYATNYSLSIGADSQLNDHAGWRLHLGTVDEPRYPKIELNLRHETFTTSVAIMNAALTIDIGDRYVINNPPPWMPPDQISQILLGYSETLGVYEHDMELNGTPESPYRMGILDDLVYGHADTDGSSLVGGASTTAAQFQVATTGASAGSPLWTTNVADFPFDVAVGGERMTVTNITGAASPQTFFVTRSVNGVVKPQAANTDVRLWQPMIMTL